MRSARALLGRHDLRAARCGQGDAALLRRRQVGAAAPAARRSANGLAWSPNGRTMYWTDTKAHTIYAFDFEPATGEIGGGASSRASRSSRTASRWTATAAGPTARRSTPKVATGGDVRGPAPAAPVARRAKCCARSSCRCAAPPCPASAGTDLKTIYPHHRAREAAGGRTRGAALGRLRAGLRGRRAGAAGQLRELKPAGLSLRAAPAPRALRPR